MESRSSRFETLLLQQEQKQLDVDAEARRVSAELLPTSCSPETLNQCAALLGQVIAAPGPGPKQRPPLTDPNEADVEYESEFGRIIQKKPKKVP
jgi:hypothetical protein